MKHETRIQIRPNTSGIPNAEYYSAEAQRLRGEYIARKLHQMINHLKQYFETKKATAGKPVITSHSLSV